MASKVQPDIPRAMQRDFQRCTAGTGTFRAILRPRISTAPCMMLRLIQTR